MQPEPEPYVVAWAVRSSRIQKHEEMIKSTSEEKARRILATAIHRYAADHTADDAGTPAIQLRRGLRSGHRTALSSHGIFARDAACRLCRRITIKPRLLQL